MTSTPPTHALYEATCRVLAHVPLPAAAAGARGLAWLWWTALPVRRDVGLENLARALPALTAGERGRILRRMMRDLALGYVELLHFLSRPACRDDMIRLEGQGELVSLLEQGQGVLLLGGHAGSWDLVLLGLGHHAELRSTCVVRPPAHPWVADFIERARRTLDVDLLPPRDCKDRILQLLDQGRTVIFPFDQRQPDAPEVPFFGRPARTAFSLAAFARRTRAPVFLLWQWREGVGCHRVCIDGPIDLEWTEDRQADLRRATRTFNALLEDRIRERPHGWFWLHRRWRL